MRWDFFNKINKLIQVFACVLLLAACGKSYITPETTTNAPSGVGIKGYDPVAYYEVAKPIKGNAQEKTEFSGVTYHFASADHRKAFEANPEKYLPAYGGYCAYAMALGNVVDINPKNWAVVNGQLYLNANGFAQSLWNLDRKGNIRDANKNWAVLKEKASVTALSSNQP